ncbi:hypothetical protein A4A49_00072 [Nicotiana attenuata]|uniref:Uncharacterized protein n=1 Tax=Nicotiana attenuata TaxID=49451 RepID=A0A1J6IHL4_NICAT|nr:hypothetical protein A4A49_00072 [Nicotiana attenuata]
MANFCITSSLFMLFILSNLVIFSQGRILTTKENVNLVVYGAKTILGAEIEKKLALLKHRFRFIEGSVDSFQPVTPGHSPGIGHSKHD